jgi:toxin-antitoxin system PIN domain toxin
VRRALLDINVLLALLDSDHVDHQLARDWINAEIQHGWASCAITQNGFVRIISQPRYPSPVSPSQAMDLLARAAGIEHHEFWPCTISVLDSKLIDRRRVHGPKQVTDAYLLALATAHHGRFVTFDQSVALSAVCTAKKDNLTVLR